VKRTYDCLKVFERVWPTAADRKVNVPDDQAQAINFLMKLSKVRYGSLIRELQNGTTMGNRSIPKTLSEAIEVATIWVPDTPFGSGLTKTERHTLQTFISTKKGPKKGSEPREGEKKPAAESPRQTDQKAGQKKKQKLCYLCQSPDHLAGSCPLREQVERLKSGQGERRSNSMVNRSVEDANDEFNANQTYLAFITHRVFCLPAALIGEILIDNQSQDHIFGNENMVEDIRTADKEVIFEGIGGQINVSKIATFRPLGVTVYFDQRAPANLLSFGKLKREDGVRVTYDNRRDVFNVMLTGGEQLTFENKNDLYVLQTRMYAYPTVAEMEKQFRSRDVRAAREAQLLHQRLGYPSTQRLMHGLRSGGILNTSVTGQDVERMVQIYGKPVAQLQGKSVKLTGPSHEVEMLPQLVNKNIRLHMDVLFYDGHAFLLSVGVPIALVQTTYLGKRKTTGLRTSASLLTACKGQLAVYQK
jgi:hypothetical protein